MAVLDLPRQMAALEGVREELETALAGDENWRALQRTGAPGGDADPDRRARDARLIKALEANPVYLAWANVSQAIDALRGADHPLDIPPGHMRGEEADAIELPEDVRASIHADAGSQDAGEETGKAAPGRTLAGIPSLDLAEGSGKVTAEPAADAVHARPRADLAPFQIAEAAEAKVSFVRRQTPAAVARSPATGAGQAATDGSAFVPAAAGAEEAEVAIVNAPVRRFLKALSGD